MTGTLVITVLLYGALTVATFGILFLMQRRWRPTSGQPEVAVPYSPAEPTPPPGAKQ